MVRRIARAGSELFALPLQLPDPRLADGSGSGIRVTAELFARVSEVVPIPVVGIRSGSRNLQPRLGILLLDIVGNNTTRHEITRHDITPQAITFLDTIRRAIASDPDTARHNSTTVRRAITLPRDIARHSSTIVHLSITARRVRPATALRHTAAVADLLTVAAAVRTADRQVATAEAGDTTASFPISLSRSGVF